VEKSVKVLRKALKVEAAGLVAAVSSDLVTGRNDFNLVPRVCSLKANSRGPDRQMTLAAEARNQS
jgi:hypothetical protein